MASTLRNVFLLCFLAVLFVCHALPRTGRSTTSTPRKSLTNGERLARGLPVSQPRRLYSPTLSSSIARRAEPSGTPAQYPSVFVTLASDPTDIIGYMSVRGSVDVESNAALASTYFPPTVPATQVVIQEASNSQWGTRDWHITVDSVQGGDVGNGSGALNLDGSGGTAMWNINSIPGVLTMAYTNSDSTIGYPNAYALADQTIYFGATAADVNTNFGTTFTEANRVILTMEYIYS